MIPRRNLQKVPVVPTLRAGGNSHRSLGRDVCGAGFNSSRGTVDNAGRLVRTVHRLIRQAAMVRRRARMRADVALERNMGEIGTMEIGPDIIPTSRETLARDPSVRGKSPFVSGYIKWCPTSI